MKELQANIFLVKKIFFKEYIYFFIPIISLALGLSLLFSSFCIFAGLHQEFYTLVDQLEPHIIIKPKAAYFENYLKLGEHLEQYSNIKEIIPTISSQGILQFDQHAVGLMIKSDPSITQTSISKELARELEVELGSQVHLMVADGEEHNLTINQLVESFGWESKKMTLQIPFAQAQEIIFGEDLINQFHLSLHNIHLAKKTQNSIQQDKVFISSTWQDKFRETLVMFQTENQIHFYLMSFLLLLILFSIHTCFSLIFLRKKQNLIALLYAKFQKKDLKRLISQLTHFSILSAILLSISISYIFKLLLETYPLSLPQSLFYSPALPFHWNWTFLLICIGVFYGGALLAVIHARHKIMGDLS